MSADVQAIRLFSVTLVGGAALALSVTEPLAQVQNYPSRPVRMIVANGPGSAPDVIARLLSAKLAESWGQNIIVDNRPGATGLIAVELLAKSAPDGHTMFLSTMTQLIAMLGFYIVVSLWFHFWRYRFVDRGAQFTMPWPKPKGY